VEVVIPGLNSIEPFCKVSSKEVPLSASGINNGFCAVALAMSKKELAIKESFDMLFI
jgi:hypothetical protein